jgi:uncharacterized protein (TIGR03437 family)
MKNLLVLLAVSGIGLHAQAVPTVNGVVNAGSFVVGSVAPGTIVSIFGGALANQTLSASTLPLPGSLAGTSVTLAGQSMPLFFVSSGQINAQVPFLIQSGSAPLVVRTSSGASTNFSVSIAATSPAVFTTTADGKGAAISVHADFRLVQKVSGQNAITTCTDLYVTMSGELGARPPFCYSLFFGQPAVHPPGLLVGRYLGM